MPRLNPLLCISKEESILRIINCRNNKWQSTFCTEISLCVRVYVHVYVCGCVTFCPTLLKPHENCLNVAIKCYVRAVLIKCDQSMSVTFSFPAWWRGAGVKQEVLSGVGAFSLTSSSLPSFKPGGNFFATLQDHQSAASRVKCVTIVVSSPSLSACLSVSVGLWRWHHPISDIAIKNFNLIGCSWFFHLGGWNRCGFVASSCWLVGWW